MNKIGLNTARLNTALLNVAYTNGFPVLSKRSGSSADISQAITDSLVCWYDIGKQQCTNESMAANPVLADLSGNGHDMTCYNFAWAEESGISTTNYPNALVSDGVDDYAYVEGLPILTDYTVIAKRIWLSSRFRDTFASKSDTIGKGAFIFEINDLNFRTYSYRAGNIIDIVNDIISYQTTNEYNGKKINKGAGEDTDKLWISKLRNGNSNIGSFALYSFLLFDRTLTTAEIEWVKKNMIEGEGVLKTDWSDSSLWIFYNLDNQGRIDGTLSSNRMVITANGRKTDISPTANFMEVIVENSIVPAYKIKVTGLKNGIVLSYIDGTINIRISEDGIYSIPEHNTQDRYFGYRFNKAFENENIVIQQLLS